MDERRRRRGGYLTPRQRKKLIGLVTQHPQLITCKVNQDFTYKDSQNLWESIANECNSIPGARKTWRQWRKTWQDLRSHTKKRQAETNGEVPPIAVMLSQAEQEALGLKNVTSTTSYQEATEFVPLEQDNSMDFNNELESIVSFSEPDSPQEPKVFEKVKKHKKVRKKSDSKDSFKCSFNCDMFAVSEQKKLQMKEDYLTFKKDYLREKLKCIRDQTEALKVIAKELCK